MTRLYVKLISCLFLAFTLFIGVEAHAIDFYKVGVDDVISIKIVDNPEFSMTAKVNADGTIAYPYLGAFNVKGFTLQEIEKKLAEELSPGYIRYPVVTVSLVHSESRKIYTYGNFNRRGEVPFMDDLTLIKAISIAGGVGNDGLFGKLTVMRKHDDRNAYEIFVEARLNNGLLFNRKTENMILEPDDILIVEKNETFLIQGEVSRRGRIVLEKDMTVLRALLEAGGVTENGLYGKIKIRRKQPGESEKYKDIAESQLNEGVMQDSKFESMILKSDDIVIVEKNETFLIQGEVSRRGRIVLEKDMTVLRALLEAGGATENGSYGKIKIRRIQPGESEEYEDIAESQLNEGVIQDSKVENMILKSDDILIIEKNETFLIQGEVSRRGRIVLEKDMTVLRALLEAGGVTENGLYGKIKIRRKQFGESEEYKDIAESQLNDGVIQSSEVEGMKLKHDDILVITKNDTFFIFGEAKKVGEYVLKNDMTVFKALILSGGFTKWGSEDRVRILRTTLEGFGFETIKVKVGDILDGDASSDVKVQKGDTIIVSSGLF